MFDQPIPVTARSKACGIACSNPTGVMDVSCDCCVLSGRGLCIELITGPEESYRVWCAWVWSWSLDNEVALARWGALAPWKKGVYLFICQNRMSGTILHILTLRWWEYVSTYVISINVADLAASYGVTSDNGCVLWTFISLISKSSPYSCLKVFTSESVYSYTDSLLFWFHSLFYSWVLSQSFLSLVNGSL